MYANEVITQLNKMTNKKGQRGFFDDKQYFDYLMFLKESVNTSHKIHLGHMKDYENILDNMKGRLFFGDNGVGVKCPYSSMWFDFLIDAVDPGDNGQRMDNIKIGIFVAHVMQDVIVCSVFTHNAFNNQWVISPTAHLYVINDEIKNRPDVIEFIQERWPNFDTKETFGNGNYAFISHSAEFNKMANAGKKGWESAQQMMDHDLSEISTVNMALKLLCCKNIVEEEVQPTKTIIKKKRKQQVVDKRKFVYKVLNLKLPKTRKKYGSSESTGSTTRVHFCRGHFRTYTEDAPMCGKFVGTVWVPSHVRGNSKKGMVVKTYDVENTGHEPVMANA